MSSFVQIIMETRPAHLGLSIRGFLCRALRLSEGSLTTQLQCLAKSTGVYLQCKNTPLKYKKIDKFLLKKDCEIPLAFDCLMMNRSKYKYLLRNIK